MLLDVNALLLPVRNRFPLKTEVDRLLPGARLAVPASVMVELAALVERGVAGARAASDLARQFPVVEGAGRGDDAIVEVAVREGSPVVTADRALSERLRALGVDVLVPRDRHRLELRRARRPRAPVRASRPGG